MTRTRSSEPNKSDENDKTGERLQRVLASRGVASRRASEQLIAAGRVQVNGKTVSELGTRVHPTKDEIRVDGRIIKRQKPRFIVLNKPSGFITTVSDENQRWTVMDLVDVPERVYPVGRLDRETQGLLLLINDGEVANRITHPKYGLTKEYHVITHKRPNDRQMEKLREGIEIEGRRVVPDEARLLRESQEGIIVKIVLHEGLYHVVRQMMEAVGIVVVKLRRVRVGPITMTGIPSGAWRDLTPGELMQLYEALGLPAEEADKVNARRTQQLIPVGGFNHGPTVAPRRGRPGTGDGTTRPAGPSDHGGREQGRPQERRGPASERGGREQGRTQEGRGDRRGPGSDQGGRGPRNTNERRSPGRGNDGTRSSNGHSNRRTGGRR